MRVFQYWYEYQGDMGSASKNPFFHHFDENLVSKKVAKYDLVSLRRADNKVFRSYTERWKKFKTDYLTTPIYPLAYAEFCVVSTPFQRRLCVLIGEFDYVPQTTSPRILCLILSHTMPLLMRRRPWRRLYFPFLLFRYVVGISLMQNMLSRDMNSLVPTLFLLHLLSVGLYCLIFVDLFPFQMSLKGIRSRPLARRRKML